MGITIYTDIKHKFAGIVGAAAFTVATAGGAVPARASVIHGDNGEFAAQADFTEALSDLATVSVAVSLLVTAVVSGVAVADVTNTEGIPFAADAQGITHPGAHRSCCSSIP